MPELPEVQTIVNRLRTGTKEVPSVCGQTIQSVQVTWDPIVAEPHVASFKRLLEGNKIIEASRRGKFLHFPLLVGHLIGHLRMSGEMRVEPLYSEGGQLNLVEKYDKVILNFESPYRMVFSNIRKFGRMWYVEDPQSVFGKLGPEPLDPILDATVFHQMLQSHSRQIKPLLMDQAFIAGLGNIYSNEALFRAHIHPLRRSDSLSTAEANQLLQEIQAVLRQGIDTLGASIDWFYKGGGFQDQFLVYDQSGEPCPVCGNPVQKITVGQRGTYFCPHCQPFRE